MVAPEIQAFFAWLADERQVANATHKQALSALLFLYSKVLLVNTDWVKELDRPRVRRRLPVVLSRDEVAAVLKGLEGEHFGRVYQWAALAPPWRTFHIEIAALAKR